MEVYLLEIYQSRAFSNEVIRIFKQLGQGDQDSNGASVYSEGAMKDLEEIERLVGDARSTRRLRRRWSEQARHLSGYKRKTNPKHDIAG